MKLKLSYKNNRGTAELCGGSSPFRVTQITGLGLPERQFMTTSYTGYDGQETYGSTCLARSITMAGDISSRTLRSDLQLLADILSVPGYLYIQSGEMERRIFCNQTVFPDAERILHGKICTFTVQFVCDNPYFENAQDISVPLYSRTKNLTTSFLLPCTFGTTVAGADIKLCCSNSVEPIIHVLFPETLEHSTTVVLTNETTGKKIELDYVPSGGEEIVIDIKNRTATSTVNGNIINSLSDDTFLSEFYLGYPENRLNAMVGDISAGIFVECIYNEKYSEAMLV